MLEPFQLYNTDYTTQFHKSYDKHMKQLWGATWLRVIFLNATIICQFEIVF